jgi:triosephosphate isomerase (TIM)
MFHFVINSKNYLEAAGPKASKLANAIEKTTSFARELNVKFYLAAPAFSISELSRTYPKISIFAQHLDPVGSGSTTGYLVPDVARISGARGSLLNHSEHRIQANEIELGVSALRKLGMISVVCARDAQEVGKFALFKPDFIAIEPPELIGSGTAVSKARPKLISESKISLQNSLGPQPSTILLCGAGIVDAIDVRRAKELGAEGILVASGVIKAKNWASKIRSLVRGFSPDFSGAGRK